jgi:circadian clock protein KaiC
MPTAFRRKVFEDVSVLNTRQCFTRQSARRAGVLRPVLLFGRSDNNSAQRTKPDLTQTHRRSYGAPFSRFIWNRTLTAHLARLTSGVAGLDQILGGGFVEGASYIIQGHPGAGKTILSNQIGFANVKAGRNVLYVTLLAETHDRLFQSLSTLDFFDDEKLGHGISYISVFQTLREEGLAAVVALLRKETARKKATLLIFDGLLNARDRALTDLDVKTFVAEVQSQAAFVGCTVLFLTSAHAVSDSPEYTMVDGVLELRDSVAGVRSVRQIQVRKSRGSAALAGLHKYEISSAGLTIYPRLESLPSSTTDAPQSGLSAISSGVEGLDELLGIGGLPSGSVTLLCGPTGSGKTSFGLSFLSKSSADQPGLHFGFYETATRLQMKARALGIDLESLVEAGHLQIVWQALTENLLDKLAYKLFDAIDAGKVKRVFIDGLGGFERAATYPPRLVAFFAALTNELRARGVTTLATWELRDLFGPTLTAPGPEISSVLDNMILMRNVELKSQYSRVISVVKVRDGKCDPIIHEVVIGDHGLKITAALEPVSGATTGIAKPLEA